MEYPNWAFGYDGKISMRIMAQKKKIAEKENNTNFESCVNLFF